MINGAQTIASSAKFVLDTGGDISKVKVSVTLIKADADGAFGKLVTRARNHQNPVLFWNFAALDDEQERLRRDLAYLDIHYAYKAEAADGHESATSIRIDEAAQALVLFEDDPRYVVRLKTEPSSLLDTTSSQYKAIFSPSLTAFRLANAVRFRRYVLSRVVSEAVHASGLQRLAYKHGNHAIAWVLAKRVSSAVNSAALIDPKKLQTALSVPFDQLRQTHWARTQAATTLKGPLALFRSQQDTVPLLQAVCIEHYGLSADPVVGHKVNQQKPGQQYPEDLFAYLVSKAPQIGNLA